MSDWADTPVPGASSSSSMANEGAEPAEQLSDVPWPAAQESDQVETAPRVRAHPVKTERHDTQAGIHHTNTGQRPVDLYREHRHRLYVSRRFVAHPRVAYWRAHLLPGGVGIQLCRYDFRGERAHDDYIDIASVSRQGHVWTMRDHYLDLLTGCWSGTGSVPRSPTPTSCTRRWRRASSDGPSARRRWPERTACSTVWPGAATMSGPGWRRWG